MPDCPCKSSLCPALDATFSKELLRLNHHMLSLLNHLSLSLDGCSLVQEDLDDPHMAVPGSTVQWGQLILTGTEKKTDEAIQYIVLCCGSPLQFHCTSFLKIVCV